MKVVIKTDMTASAELFRLAEIVTKLRYNTEYWKEHYGCINRARKEYWEKKADEWIKNHVKQQDEHGCD